MKMRKILFLLSARALSGGVLVVRQHARLLAERGYEVTVSYLFETDLDGNPESVLSTIAPAREIMHKDLACDEIFDVAVATWWETAYHLSEVKAKGYAYFIQGFEERLYPKDSYWPLLVQRTYQSNFKYIVVNSGVQKHLADNYGQAATVIPPGIRLEDFDCEPLIPRVPEKLRVMVEGSPQAEFKRVDLALEALSRVSEVEVVHVSPKGKPRAERRVDHFFECVAHSQMPRIYKSCDLILKLSTDETVSMPVLEAFASGATAIVSQFFGGSDLIRDGENALVVPVDDIDAAVVALTKLRDQRDVLQSLKTMARSTAKQFAWTDLSASMEAELQQCFELADTGKPAPLAGCLPSFQAAHTARLELEDYEPLKSRYWQLLQSHDKIHMELQQTEGEVSALKNSRSYRVGNTLARAYRSIHKVVN